jgi:UDP-2,3-diacylglucosamine hydrolase
LSLATRQAFAAAARQGSKQHTAQQQAMLMDVNTAAVEHVLRVSGCSVLLHGHTHRPGSHELLVEGRPCRRLVLGDWYTQQSALRWDEGGPQFV